MPGRFGVWRLLGRLAFLLPRPPICVLVSIGVAGTLTGCVERGDGAGPATPVPVELNDSDEISDRYPFLAEAFDEAVRFNEEFPNAVPSRLLVGEIPVAEGNESLVVAQFTGVMYCGTLGCATSIHARKPGGEATLLWGGYVHRGTIQIRSCASGLTFVWGEGNGLDAGWTERRVSDFSEVWTGRDLSELPDCM